MRASQPCLNLGITLTTLVGVTMLSSQTSHALTLETNDGFSFVGRVEISNNGSNNYDFDFLEFSAGSDFEGLNVNVTADKFQAFDGIKIANISSPEAGAFPAAPFADFISDILLADGTTTASFDIETFTFVATDVDHHMIFDVVFTGFLDTSLGQLAAASGSLTTQMYLASIHNTNDQGITSFSGTLRVTDPDVSVPTPAAILPSLLTLGGVATQRKRSPF